MAIMEKTSIYVETIRLESAAEGPLADLLTMLDHMQEVAGRHALQLGWGLPELQANDLTWVLARYHFILPRWPLNPGPKVISTWPSGRRGLYAFRDFHITDEGDSGGMRGTSAWVILDMVRRRPARLDNLALDFEPAAGRMIDDEFRSLPAIQAMPGSGESFTVRPEDIDVNDHVNNLVYLDWARRMLPPGSGKGPGVLELEVAFLAEARRGDRVRGVSQASGPEREPVIIQSLSLESSGRELTRLRWRWFSAKPD